MPNDHKPVVTFGVAPVVGPFVVGRGVVVLVSRSYVARQVSGSVLTWGVKATFRFAKNKVAPAELLMKLSEKGIEQGHSIDTLATRKARDEELQRWRYYTSADGTIEFGIPPMWNRDP